MKELPIVFVVLLLVAPFGFAQAPDREDSARDVATLILPDGSTETIVLTGDEVIRLIVRDGTVEVVRREGDRRAVVLARATEGRDEVVDVELGAIFERLPEIVRERLEEVTLPRVRVEVEAPSELRRQISEVERASRRAALEVRRAERDGDLAAAERHRAELTRILEEAFDLRQAEREARLEAIRERETALAAEAREMEDELRLRSQRRAELIERRAEELTRDREALDW